jgi:DNA end-binding protein Ku
MPESIRTFWKGHIRLALVTIPVKLVSAEKSEAVPKFHQIDRKSKQRIRYQKVVPGKGEVAKDDIVLGYEVEPGNYVFMEDEELDAVKLKTRHTIELVQFVETCEIDPLYFDQPYYVLPDGEVAEEGYRVVRDALRKKRKVAIGQLTLRGREHLVSLYPTGNGIALATLRYETELKDDDEIFEDISGDPGRADMVAMAEQLIESRTEDFEPNKFKNHYAEALRDLVKQKLAAGGATPIEENNEGGAKVLDFMEALKRSLQGGAAAAEPAPAPKAAKGKAKAQAEPEPPARKPRAKAPAAAEKPKRRA